MQAIDFEWFYGV